MASDELSYSTNVDLAFEVQSNFSETREPQFEFSVEIEPTGGLDAPCLNLTVGQRRVVAFLPGQTLYVYCDEALVGKDHRVAHAFEAEVNGLIVDEDGR